MDTKGGRKLIAPKRMEINIRMPVGSKYCVLSLSVEKDVDITEFIQRCMQAENLPPYTEQSILACVSALLEEDRRRLTKDSELGV